MTHDEMAVTRARNAAREYRRKDKQWGGQAKSLYHSALGFAVAFIVYAALAVFYKEEYLWGFFTFGAFFVLFFLSSVFCHRKAWAYHKRYMAEREYISKHDVFNQMIPEVYQVPLNEVPTKLSNIKSIKSNEKDV